MAAEQDKQLIHPVFEGVFTSGHLVVDDDRTAVVEQQALARKLFGLALALATEPSKLGQVRQMLVQLQEQREVPDDFSSWALGQLDARLRLMVLEYAHDAESVVQILSFRGGTFASLAQVIEDLYQHEQITQRVYVKAKLLLKTLSLP